MELTGGVIYPLTHVVVVIRRPIKAKPYDWADEEDDEEREYGEEVS